MNKYRYIYLYLTFILFTGLSYAQFNPHTFLKKFQQADYKEKVRMVANTDFNDLKPIYPQIQDTLEHIKKYVYTQTISNEAKFLFDIIDAQISMYNNQFPKCIAITTNALQYHCDNINDSLKTLLLLKECLLKINDYTKALEIHKLIEKHWHRKTIALWIGTAKSTIYSYIGMYKYAIAERRREYEAGSHDHWETARMYNDIGVFFNRMQKYDSAESYFNKALKELAQINKQNVDTSYYQFFVAIIKSNMAIGYLKNKKYKNALPYLLSDVHHSMKNKEYESAYNAYLGLIEIYLNLNKLTFAKKYLDTLNTLDIPEFRYPKNVAKKYLWTALYYEKTGELNKAMHCLKQYININDSIRETEKELQTINAEIAYKAAEKDAAIKEKNTALTILKIQKEKSDTIKTYLILFIIILLIAGFILFRYYRKAEKHAEELEKTNTTIQHQNQLIQKTLKEKEMLLKEIHHRVKNNLQIISSIIRLQMNKEKNEKAQILLNEISSRIQSIALTHQMLYKQDQFMNLRADEYQKNLCQQIITTFSKDSDIQIHYTITPEETDLPIDIAIPLGLICNEVITNAIKYAFPNKQGKIHLHFSCINNVCQLIIQDNGIGIDIEKTKQTETLGMELIKLLSEQIDAQYTFKVQNGTIFQLHFLKPNHQHYEKR